MFELKVPSGRLRFARFMSVAELKTITEQEIINYTTEWHSTIQPAQEKDFSTLSNKINDLFEQGSEIFGEGSKQEKYLKRNYKAGDTKIHAHYDEFLTPEAICRALKQIADGFFEDSYYPWVKDHKK
jgi:hypothetical protein